ncbi:putative metal-dependent hydrolase [Chryseobacterium sp. RG1]|uniref:Metal-dependent hydrolase n=1 Tax=Chryseobacterium tagetis TaxID=2801334 RepID=A0ABS7ZXQ0_9FLAO|nr:putative metal-dependent hydrolase [Chryseobacterium tagetis]MCA6066357.1 putative metal-dependent hydrolase [Chryseobacterium tagetis]
MNNIDQKRFPIGEFLQPENITREQLTDAIDTISDFPKRLKKLVENMSDEQLDTPYREGGWTIRQVINHLADSHINSFTRFKLALTEDNPTIKPYEEAKWAELADSVTMPIKPALRMIKGTHQRWSVLLKSLSEEQFNRTFHHPEQNINYTLKNSATLYAWHCNHHFAHIENLKNEKGW